VNPVLSATNIDGAWYPDRYEPAGFAADAGRLKISISAADGAQVRPGAYSGAFYNTQGRKFNQCGNCVTVLRGDVFIPADWATKHRRTDMWATTFDISNAVEDYPIIGFANTDGLSPTLRYWDGSGAGVWVNVPGLVYDTWITLEASLVGGNIVYKVNGSTVGTVASAASVYYGNIIMQAYNFNDNTLGAAYDNTADNSYDAFWDNLVTTGLNGNVVTNLTTGESFCTIQSAIDAPLTVAGNTISVGPGTYNEKLTINKALTLQGVNEANCIIDGTGLGNGSGITINSGITNVVIQYFTIKNHAGTSPNTFAGIFATGGNHGINVQHCTIKDNIGGSGFYANGPVNGVTLNDLDVSGHTNAFGAARGIVIWNGLKENISITNCEVYNNNF